MTHMPEIVDVVLGERGYAIHIDAGLLQNLPAELHARLKNRRLCVVTDETVAKIYLLPLMQLLETAGYQAVPPVIVPAGENSKNFDIFQSVVEKFLSYKLDRKCVIIALGGGVIGDLTGFAASVLLRGVEFVQIPTTLLAQVDSSVGGKTGINTRHGKNLVGSFYQPAAVIIDTATLATLPPREVRAGYAEIVKYGLIDDAAFFEWLEKNGAGVLAGDAALQKHAIAHSCRAKAAVVVADEREEKDLRALLNLGHTFGHAIEALGQYDGRVLHGEAVAMGMVLAYDYAASKGLCDEAAAQRVRAHIEKAGLASKPPFRVEAADMVEKMRGDKKNTEGKITLILPRAIGDTFVARGCDENDIRAFLSAAIGAGRL